MSTAVFIYNGTETHIQCLNSDKMEVICNRYAEKESIDINKIYFIHGSNNLNLELTFEQQANEVDKEHNIMKILVCEKDKSDLENDGIKKAENIICPKCGENCLIKFNDFIAKMVTKMTIYH